MRSYTDTAIQQTLWNTWLMFPNLKFNISYEKKLNPKNINIWKNLWLCLVFPTGWPYNVLISKKLHIQWNIDLILFSTAIKYCIGCSSSNINLWWIFTLPQLHTHTQKYSRQTHAVILSISQPWNTFIFSRQHIKIQEVVFGGNVVCSAYRFGLGVRSANSFHILEADVKI